MNVHALGILELARVLSHVSQRAHSAPGGASVRALVPLTDRDALHAEPGQLTVCRADALPAPLTPALF
jgi:hypothetical protein